MNTVKFSCAVQPTDATIPLNFEVLLDNVCVYQLCPVTQSTPIEIEIPEDPAQHRLQLRMSGKTRRHTRLDVEGNIVQDACLKIFNMCFDHIDITDLLPQTAVYHHDFNGTSTPTQDRFYELMGCNGSVDIEFSTPIYLWLLENM